MSTNISLDQNRDGATEFNWRTGWYPIVFVVDLPADQPYGFSIFAEPFVLFRNRDDDLVCLVDRCPHRLAKLSDGRVTDGQLECLYHGWQFGTDGTCQHIPQLPGDAKIPARAQATAFPVKEHQGIVWIWADSETPPLPTMPPAIDEIEAEGVFQVDTATDLPFDHTFLVENLLDPAHVYISHDGTELGIRRDDAAPLAIEILTTSIDGIESRFRQADQPQAPWVNLTFHAPMLVHYSFSNPAYGVVGGLGLYAIPIAPRQSRILVRRYGTFFKRPFTLKPRWLEHLRQNKILEEDLPFIVAQDRFFQGTQRSLKSTYFPIKTCDPLVIAHRRWLDQFGQNLPWYVGFATTKQPAAELCSTHSTDLPSRFERHTRSCQACRGAHGKMMTIQRAGWVGAVISIAFALMADGERQWVFVLSFLLAMVAIATANQLQQKFENTFQRP